MRTKKVNILKIGGTIKNLEIAKTLHEKLCAAGALLSCLHKFLYPHSVWVNLGSYKNFVRVIALEAEKFPGLPLFRRNLPESLLVFLKENDLLFEYNCNGTEVAVCSHFRTCPKNNDPKMPNLKLDQRIRDEVLRQNTEWEIFDRNYHPWTEEDVYQLFHYYDQVIVRSFMGKDHISGKTFFMDDWDILEQWRPRKGSVVGLSVKIDERVHDLIFSVESLQIVPISDDGYAVAHDVSGNKIEFRAL